MQYFMVDVLLVDLVQFKQSSFLVFFNGTSCRKISLGIRLCKFNISDFFAEEVIWFFEVYFGKFMVALPLESVSFPN